MAQIIPIGQAQNEAERKAIKYLQERLPADYRVLHNFELRSADGQWFEIDLAVIAPHAIYLVDTKSTYGEIFVSGGKWHPAGRAPYESPLAKLRHHTRRLHGLFCDAAGGPHADLRRVWVEAVVLLTAPDAVLRDPEGRDVDHTWPLDGCEKRFKDVQRLPDRTPPLAKTMPHLGRIMDILQGKARAQQRLPLLGRSWQCEERLTGNDFYTEYRARNATSPGPRRYLVRLYNADPYLPEEERKAQAGRIGVAFRALQVLPAYPAIPIAYDFFPTERDDGFVLVLDEAPGRSLRVHLLNPKLPLTMDQKIAAAKDLLGALAHCHAHGVLHRAVSPDTLVVGPDGRTRLVDFDFARPGQPHDVTIAEEVAARVSPAYLAPEVKDSPANFGTASDVYAAGATLYELFTGKPTFTLLDQALAATSVFPERASQLIAGMPAGFDTWLESLCAFDPAKRPAASAALEGLLQLFEPPRRRDEFTDESSSSGPELDYRSLVPGTMLKGKYRVEAPLGKGGFSLVYKVIDTWGDVTRALKIVTTDRTSPSERMKQEYRTLANVPEHPSVVRVFDGDFLEGQTVPCLIMEYVEGANVAELIRDGKLSLSEARDVGIQVADGLAHLHSQKPPVTHGDIKPANLMWTQRGVKIIDFNVAIRAGDANARGGGTRKYLPPDLDSSFDPTESERMDRDLFALGISLYEAVTGSYPWPGESAPVAGKAPADPRKIEGLEDLSPALVTFLLKAVAVRRADRFASAKAFGDALRAVGRLREPNPEREQQVSTQSAQALAGAGVARPNFNPFVSFLLTMYSQSRQTNAGTRGLDAMGRQIYVPTAMDRVLLPAALDGAFRLVIISGNAGDGKTAFILQMEEAARKRGAEVRAFGSGNGSEFTLKGRRFLTNYDGSQDEGAKVNDVVLGGFFAPYQGADASGWPAQETRVIAINEGRLIDYLEQFGARFQHLKQLVRAGLGSGEPVDGVLVVNLNLRSVVAAANGEAPILDRLARKLTEPKFWAPCQGCDLRDRCYVHHNAQTFASRTGGPQVLERLRLLYRLTIMRGRLHVTLRDLGSALAYTIAGTRNCDEIHALYERGARSEILGGFYFNSWAAAGQDSKDRLLRLLSDVDVGKIGDPKLDRLFDFHPPDPAPLLVDFAPRGRYDRDLLTADFGALPSGVSGHENQERFSLHRTYVAMMRRRHFFEVRDESWQVLVPYASSSRMLDHLGDPQQAREACGEVLRAINRGEGIFDSRRLRGKLALQVREVEPGALRSYRVFPAERFELVAREPLKDSPYLEHEPTALLLRYADETGLRAELVLTLDVFEMLQRLKLGYRPTVDEVQGYYLSLAVFKNILGSAPYREVLLTPSGHEFYAVSRTDGNSLTMRVVEEAAVYGS
jgi:serine/threonine protein kinase